MRRFVGSEGVVGGAPEIYQESGRKRMERLAEAKKPKGFPEVLLDQRHQRWLELSLPTSLTTCDPAKQHDVSSFVQPPHL